MDRFTNKIVVITGGTSGIGLAAARQFIKEGATVVVIGRSPRSIGDAQKEIGANGIAIAADVTKSAELDAVFQTVREKYGRIDVLYTNAGVCRRRACVAPDNTKSWVERFLLLVRIGQQANASYTEDSTRDPDQDDDGNAVGEPVVPPEER
jgi:NADP-dependent 3-hydroxy acid dehydrogenase YdfG